MDAFGPVAVRAAELASTGVCASPTEAWAVAAREAFPESHWMQIKSCPRGAFLGLCEEGFVADVPAGSYTNSRENKADAVRAAGLLAAEPALALTGPGKLWKRVLGSRSKAHNSQMNVVLALHRRGLLVGR